jgi:hypothetical protein
MARPSMRPVVPVTAEERAHVRALVERTCAAQGVPLVVSPDVAQAVAAMIAGRPRSQNRLLPPPDVDMVDAQRRRGGMLLLGGGGGDDASGSGLVTPDRSRWLAAGPST